MHHSRQLETLLINDEEVLAYDTGDLGRLSPRNEILFEGRADDQVKINGYRIELGEIAHHLSHFTEIRQSIVVVNTTTTGEKQLIAFVIPRKTTLKSDTLRAALARRLPPYMVPQIVIHKSEFPMTSANKIDRAALLSSLSDRQAPLKKSARRVQDVLAEKGVDAAVVELPASTRTAIDAACALDCEIDQIVKTLVFRKHGDTSPIVVLIGGDDRVDMRKLARTIGEPVERADAKFVKKSTGFAIGGVPPVGHAVTTCVVVEETLAKRSGVWAAAGTPNAVFRVPGSVTSILDNFIVAEIREV